MDYATYIQSAEWRIVADRALARAGHKCQVCSSIRQLNVHHNTYERVGCELDTDLCVLCRPCHELFHAPVNGKPTRMPGKGHKQKQPQPKPRGRNKRVNGGKSNKHRKRLAKQESKRLAREMQAYQAKLRAESNARWRADQQRRMKSKTTWVSPYPMPATGQASGNSAESRELRAESTPQISGLPLDEKPVGKPGSGATPSREISPLA
jgi:hypothetical protein